MRKAEKNVPGLTLLGRGATQYPADYDPGVLETFVNRHQENDYWVKFNCPEFTSLCPITGQPDFATLYISYVPDVRMVESKSLKLYLFGFRNHGAFHEDVVNLIMKDLVKLMDPKYIEVGKISAPGRHFHRSLRELRAAGDEIRGPGRGTFPPARYGGDGSGG